ncbi:proline-rich receptor-like protein kinase PERK2 [Poecilia reticulata]|uniref:proline-rich receptor-like protein kinase PERK2 n=1 Tax=Poecilia reticulata TaxID=8081 RepID=UPI0007EB12F2|nr:PREDICTED: proline-rich receptor-like protein kinase PERK2 [Poecilia reticulata]
MKTFWPWYISGACCRLNRRIFITSRSLCTLAMTFIGKWLRSQGTMRPINFYGLRKVVLSQQLQDKFETNSAGRPPSTPSGRPPSTPSGRPPSTPSGRPPSTPSGRPPSTPSGRPPSTPSGRPPSTPSGRPPSTPSGRPPSTPSGRPPSTPSGRPSYTPSGRPPSTPSGRPSYTPSGRPPSTPSLTPTIRMFCLRERPSKSSTFFLGSRLAAASSRLQGRNTGIGRGQSCIHVIQTVPDLTVLCLQGCLTSFNGVQTSFQ